MLPALQHWAFAISTPADRQQGQIVLKVLEPVELVAPWRTIWRMVGYWGRFRPSCGSWFACFDTLQLKQMVGYP
jgi:hypothetical protein